MMFRIIALAAFAVALSEGLKCADLGLLCSGAHPTEFAYTLNQSAIPSFDGSAYIWAKTGTVITSQTESIHCQEFTNYLAITANGIPNHDVGKFPFTQGTTGRGHGDNPNTIKAQNYAWKIPKTPVKKTVAPTSNIMTNFRALQQGPIGFALNGVPIFNPLNNNREDAVSPTSNGYEVMDLCFGHPQMAGGYHYHHQASKAGCLFTDTPGQHSPKIGYAFDGIAVYGPLSDNGVKPTDLDICNGRTHKTLGYIYHITGKTAPYMIGCYSYQVTDAVRGGAISTAGATAVGGVSTACSNKIGQPATVSTASTKAPSSTTTKSGGSSTTKPSTGSTTVGGGCPSVMMAQPQCATDCSSNSQCSGQASVCCKTGSCSTGKCLRPCPTMTCTNACPGARSADAHGCPSCTCSGGTMPPATGGPRTQPAGSTTRPHRGTGTGSRRPRSTPQHMGTLPGGITTSQPGNGLTGANNAVTTTASAGTSPPDSNTTLIVAVVAGVVAAVAVVLAAALIIMRRKAARNAAVMSSTYRDLQEDLQA